MSFSEREKQLIRAAYAWGQITLKEGYSLSDLEIEKSVLFRRLLAGRPPLAFPPPLRHGFPWHEVIEGRGEHIVNASDASPECSMIAPGSKPGDTCVLIDGAFWRVAKTLREGEEYIVEWGQYPMQWRLKKRWEVNYEMTQQLSNFQKQNPRAVADFESRTGRDYSEFRIDDEQTVWLSEWQLSRIGLPGWVWAGSPVADNMSAPLAPLRCDQQGALLLAEAGNDRGAAWLRIEEADGDSRYIKLGDDLEYQPLAATADTAVEHLLRNLKAETLEIMDWRDGKSLRHYLVPAHLVPLEQFDIGGESYDLVPDNAYSENSPAE